MSILVKGVKFTIERVENGRALVSWVESNGVYKQRWVALNGNVQAVINRQAA